MLENKLGVLATKRDALAAQIEPQLGQIPGCTGFGTADLRRTFVLLSQDARNLLIWLRQAEDHAGIVDPGA